MDATFILKSFTAALERYSENTKQKREKGLFFCFFFKYTRELSVRARTEGEDSLNILYKTHYLRLQAHLSDSILNESMLSCRRIKKPALWVSVTNVGFLSVSKC